MRERAQELLPQVLLTLLSLIQAIALEGLWSRASGSPHLQIGEVGALAAVAGWLQVVAIICGILLIWLIYTSLVIRLTWVPTTRDSIFPYGIGLLEFAAIESLGPEHAVRWALLMGVIFLFVTWASVDIATRAMRERGEDRSALRGIGWLALAVGAHLALAGGLAIFGGYGAFAVFAYAMVTAMLLVQTWVVHRQTTLGLENA